MPDLIYTTVNEVYECYATACFNSLHENYPDHPLVIVNYTSLTGEFIDFVNTLPNFQLRHISVSSEYKDLGPVGNPIIYDRFKLWTSDYDEYDTILHLDVDTLILAPLDDLFKDKDNFFIVDNNETLSGVSVFKNHDEKLLKLMQEDKLTDLPMANTGVFVIPKAIRKNEDYDFLKSTVNDFDGYLNYADQSAINIWMQRNKIKPSSDIRWNFQPQFFGYPDVNMDLSDVKILHFAARKADTMQFLLWWRLQNVSIDLHNLYTRYLRK